MKKTYILFLFLITFSIVEAYARDSIMYNSDTLKIATYNIRIKTKNDRGLHSWKNRKASVAKLIKSNKIDICAVQEIKNKSQERKLQKLLPNFSLYSKARENNRGSRGERIGILYSKTRFQKENDGFFFLSPTPTISSKGWDAASNRICVWVKLYDKISQQSLYVFDAHFDHKGSIAREKSAELIISKIKEIADNKSVICCGDFNASPAETKVHDALKTELIDSEQIADIKMNTTVGTFNSWADSISSFPENTKIDYIYCKDIQVFTYNILNTKIENDAYPSDHFPVMIKCKLKD